MDKIYIVLQKNTFHLDVKSKPIQAFRHDFFYDTFIFIHSPTRLTSSGKNTVAEKLAVVYEEDMPVGQRWFS